MSDSYSTKRNFPFLSEFSPKDARLAERAASHGEERQCKAYDAHAQKARDIAEDARRRLRDLVGKRGWDSLRESMRYRRLAFRDLLPAGDQVKVKGTMTLFW